MVDVLESQYCFVTIFFPGFLLGLIVTYLYLRDRYFEISAMPDWFNISRALSLVIAFIYLGIASYFALSAAKLFASLLITSGALLLPLACIWYGDELGEYVDAVNITRKSPGWMLKVGGWVLLLLPAIRYWFVIRY